MEKQRNGDELRRASVLRTATDWHRMVQRRAATKRRSLEQQSKGTASKSLARTRNAKEQIRWQRNGIAQLARIRKAKARNGFDERRHETDGTSKEKN